MVSRYIYRRQKLTFLTAGVDLFDDRIFSNPSSRIRGKSKRSIPATTYGADAGSKAALEIKQPPSGRPASSSLSVVLLRGASNSLHLMIRTESLSRAVSDNSVQTILCSP